MRGVFALVLLVGMGLAGFAVYTVQGFVSQQETALAQERAKTARTVPTTQIYAPRRTITYGEPILPGDVTLIDYAIAFVPEGSFATLEEIFPDGEDVPRIALRQMEINEPILAIKVTQPGRDTGITSRLSRGMRAFTIKVDVASGMSGFLRPSHRVDVYWTGFAGNGNRQSFTQLIKSGVEIIAIDQTADGDRSGVSVAHTVTVQVSPQDVGILAQAQSSGALTLSLVGDDDDSLSENVLVDQRALLGLAEDPVIAQVEVAPVDRVCTIKTRRGADVLQIPVPCSD